MYFFCLVLYGKKRKRKERKWKTVARSQDLNSQCLLFPLFFLLSFFLSFKHRLFSPVSVNFLQSICGEIKSRGPLMV